MSFPIPDGTYELKIGESCTNSSSRAEFNTLRFDFKPASISSGSEAYIATSGTENVQVIVPGENNKSTIFRGSKKPIRSDKDCLLVFNHETKQLRLEKVSSNINVKKTRDTDLESGIKSQVELMRKKKMPIKKETVKERTSSTSSVSVNGEDNGEEEAEEEDEDASALEQMMALKMEPNSPQKSHSPAKQQTPTQQKASSPVKKLTSPTKAHKGLQKSILHEDLELSESSAESSDEDENA